MNPVIRQLKDVNSILSILNRYKQCLASLSKSESYRELMAKKFYENAVFIVAEIGDIPIGFCSFYANDNINKKGYISMIAVESEYRRHHIGFMLLNETISISKELGMKQMRLEVSVSNNNAILFYKRNGFDFITTEIINNKIQMKRDL